MHIRQKSRRLRVGIYTGAFDPVHSGHISFALQALKAAHLDQVVFLPERRPLARPGVEHYAHRVAMLKSALLPYHDLAVMEMVDRHFTVTRTLPLLRSVFADSELVFMMGSDSAANLPASMYADRLVRDSELVIGTLDGQAREGVEQAMEGWPFALASRVTVIDSYAPDVSSRRIREALRRGTHAKGLLASVRRYSKEQWLYVSPAYAAKV
jgi:nicotinate-nucleotide adenylyltransferase